MKKLLFINIYILLFILTLGIKIGVYENPPMVINEKEGFFPEYILHILSDDFDVDITMKSQSVLMGELKNGEIDALLPLGYSEERDELYDFNKEAFTSNWGIIYKRRDSLVNAIFDLENKKIGVMKTDIFYVGHNGLKFLLESFDLDAIFVEYDSYTEIFEAAQKGDVDLAAVNKIFGMKNHNKFSLLPTDIVFSPINVLMMIREDYVRKDELINLVDSKLKEDKNNQDSFYHTLLSKYINSTVEVIPTWIKTIALWGVLLFFIIIVGISINRNILSKLVKKRTEELEKVKNDLIKNNKTLENKNEEIENQNYELEKLYNENEHLSESLKSLIFILSNIGKHNYKTEDHFLDELLKTLLKLIPNADYGTAFRFIDHKVKFVSSYGHDLEMLKSIDIDENYYFESIDHPIIFDKTINYENYNLSDEAVKKIKKANKPIKQSITMGLNIEDKKIAGISIDISDQSAYFFSKKDLELIEAFRTLASTFYSVKLSNERIFNFQKNLIISFLQLLEIHDEYTKEHSENVANLTEKVMKILGYEEDEIKTGYWAATVHDVGKTLISEDILNKKERLTDQEYKIIKMHPVWAYMALSKNENLKNISNIVLHHHERWDGKGYPDKLTKNQIPEISQIICVVDAWDAMTSKRSYRDALSREEAIEELIKNKGTQFSPKIVDTFLNFLNS
jgi:HD-GYP domain-containing protein (c-di-GMP phosphodiesterase class II)/ABC-type amino acid transport substrate-binding protein